MNVRGLLNSNVAFTSLCSSPPQSMHCTSNMSLMLLSLVLLSPVLLGVVVPVTSVTTVTSVTPVTSVTTVTPNSHQNMLSPCRITTGILEFFYQTSRWENEQYQKKILSASLLTGLVLYGFW